MYDLKTLALLIVGHCIGAGFVLLLGWLEGRGE